MGTGGGWGRALSSSTPTQPRAPPPPPPRDVLRVAGCAGPERGRRRAGWRSRPPLAQMLLVLLAPLFFGPPGTGGAQAPNATSAGAPFSSDLGHPPPHFPSLNPSSLVLITLRQPV